MDSQEQDPHEVEVVLGPPSANLYGHLFDNARTGLPRRIYWAIEFSLAGVAARPPAATLAQVEWLTWRVAHWHDLEGQAARDLERPELAEASVYVQDHEPYSIRALEIRARRGHQFLVHATLLPKSSTHDLEPVDVTAWATFDGIIVQPSMIDGEHTSELATKALEPFLRATDLQPARWDRFRYILAPVGHS